MAMNLRTTWVKPPHNPNGQDHLGARILSERIYSTLVPGITNVTDRARMLGFYPWLLAAYQRRGGVLDAPSMMTLMRRAEVLLGLVTIVHAGDVGEAGGDHDRGVVGSRVLNRVAYELRGGESFRISDVSHNGDGPRARYFGNTWGGFGQYYWGPMVDLGIIGTNPDAPVPGYRPAGAEIAAAFTNAVPEDVFFATLEGDAVDLETLRTLAPFCLCGCKSAASERDLVIDRLLGVGSGSAPSDERRRETLLLILHLAAVRADAGLALNEYEFRAAAATGAAVSGVPWQPPEALAGVTAAWRAYQWSEVLSVAAQALLWVAATTLEVEHGGVLSSPGALVEQVVALHPGAIAELGDSFDDAVEATRAALPPVTDWADERHEHRRVIRIFEAVQDRYPDRAKREAALLEAVTLLLALVARPAPACDFSALEITQSYLDDHPINLARVAAIGSGRWRRLTTKDWLTTVVRDWGVLQHLHVALAKLRSQGHDTFRFRAQDEGLVLCGGSGGTQAQYSGPRFNNAVRMLMDLDLMVRDGDGWIPTAAGRARLEAHLG